MIYLLLFTLGLIVGSFLNVVSLRYSPEGSFFPPAGGFKKWMGRSHCMTCGKTLSWYELVPVLSFVLQKGKCRSCGVILSLQYPLIEITTGFIFLFPFYLYTPLIPYSLFLIQSILWILIFIIFLLLWIIDYQHYIIPDELTIGLALLGIGIAVLKPAPFIGYYAMLFGLQDSIWINQIVAVLIPALVFGLIILLTRGRGMGMGDLKLITALGIVFGWPDIIFVIIFSFLIGAIVSSGLLASGKKIMKDHIPFGPFIILGALTVIFFGHEILNVYFNFFNLI